MSDDPKAADVIRQWGRLDGGRGVWKEHWQRIADYMLPDRRDYIVHLTPGMKRMQFIFDATPVWALQQFAAGLHSLLTSPTLRWFGLKTEDSALDGHEDVQLWLDDTSNRMYSLFNSPRHNFASQSNELYLDIGSIGTAVMAVLESEKSGVLFSTRNLKECVVCENDEDRIDTLIRRWPFTARQAFQCWGERAGPAVLKAMDVDPQRQMHFLHAVRPRLKRNPGRADAANKRFESLYVCESDGTLIGEGGFDEFPYLVPRFSKATGETYGRGPGMTVLPDVQMLNEMQKLVLKSAQKVIDPPLLVPDDGFMVPIKTVPGALNYYRAGSRDRIEPIQTQGQVSLGIEMLGALRQQIIRGFYVEWMMMPSDPTDPAAAGKGVTATYVLQQRDEKMRLLSPMLARLQSEFLGPLIDRVFAIMWRQSAGRRFGPGSMLAPPPPALSGVALRVEYVSPIAIAQRSSQLDSIGRLVQTAMMLGQVDPAAPKALDTDAILRLTARDLNTPAAALKSRDQMAAEQQAMAQQQQDAAQHAAMANVAASAKDGTAAVKNLADAAAAQPANNNQVAAA